MSDEAPTAERPRKFHFISGLPRSGSTLLSAILQQNPRFHAGMTSPVADMLSVLVAEMSGKNDFSVVISDEQRSAVLRAVIDTYYRSVPDADVVFDTSRVWCGKMPMLVALYPNAKVIVCVRDIAWVLDSMERLVRKQPFTVNKIFRYSSNLNVYSRAEALIDPKGMVGVSFQTTKDAFYGDCAPGRLLLLTYEGLTRDPKAAMNAIYQFIGEPWFEHDFEHVEYKADEFDSRVGVPGLHTVQSRVSAPKRQSILPPDLFQRFANESFWLDPRNNIRRVPIVR
jgi:sulfotransferase